MKLITSSKTSGLNLFVNGCLMKADYQEWKLTILMSLLSAYLGVEKAVNPSQVSISFLRHMETKARKEGQVKFILPVELRYLFNGLMKFDFEIIVETTEFSNSKKGVENGRGCTLFLNGKFLGGYKTFIELYKAMKDFLKGISIDPKNPIKMPQGAAIALYKELIRNGSLTLPHKELGFFFTITKS